MVSKHASSEPEVENFQYQLGKCIRVDFDGELFESHDQHLSRPVWIRKISLSRFDAIADVSSKLQREQAIEDLRQRIRQVASLQHPAFARIHKVEEFEGCIYVVMEAVSGRSLADVESIPNDVAQLSKYLFDVASALQEAHAQGLVHGDLKPDNLIVDRSGHIRVLNFSLAPGTPSHIFGSESQIDPFGSLAYTAPERFSQSLPQAASDLYALGVTWYFYICGSLPFSDLSGLALVAEKLQHDSSRWNWPTTLPEPVCRILANLTATNVETRPSAKQLRELCFALIPSKMWSQSLNRDELHKLKLEISQQVEAEIASVKQKPKGVAARFKLKPLLFACLLIGVSLIGIWQMFLHGPQLLAALKPYSSSRELQQGVSDLTEYQIRPRAEKLTSAIQHFQTVLEHEPQNAEAVAYMAVSHLSRYYATTRDDIWFQRAKAGAQQAMLLAPRAAPSLLAQARIQQGHHKLSDALRSAELGLQIAPEQLLLWHCKMSILLEAGHQDEALRFGTLGAAKFPQDRYLLDLMAGIYLNQTVYDKAIPLLEESIRRQPESQLAYSLMAIALNSQGRRDDALAVIQRGLLIGPQANLYSSLGDLRFQDGDFESAAQAYENAVSVNKGVAGSYLRWFQYAEALVQLPAKEAAARVAHQKALDLLELRLQRSPDDPVLMSISAVIQARLGRPEKARDQIRRSLQLESMTGECYFWIALSYRLVGEKALAREALNQSRERGYDPLLIASYPDLKSF